MGSLSKGLLAALLLFVLLLAVPFLAAFGLPHLGPAASPTGSHPPGDAPRTRAGVGESARYSVDDLFAPFDAASGDRTPRPDDGTAARGGFEGREIAAPASPTPGRPGAVAGGEAGDTRDEPFDRLDRAPRPSREDARARLPEAAPPRPRRVIPAVRADAFADPASQGGLAFAEGHFPEDGFADDDGLLPDGDGVFPPADEHTLRGRRSPPVDEFPARQHVAAERDDPGPLTWRQAVRRLNDLGIRDYQLKPGAGPGEFHFRCFLTPSDSPRITHRFEAEAADPLEAVEDVLAQIEEWLQRR